MRVGGAAKEILIEAGDELVLWVRQVARHLLLDGATLLRPFLRRVLGVPHAGRVHSQRDFQVLRRHGDEILGDVLLRIGIGGAAQLRIDGGDLIPGQARAPAERHVLLRMRRSGEARGRFVAANQVVLLDGGHRRQRIAHDHHAQSVVQRSAHHRRGGVLLGRGGAGHEDGGGYQQDRAAQGVHLQLSLLEHGRSG